MRHVGLLTLALVTCALPARTQTLRDTPGPGYRLVDARIQGPFELKRWAATATEISPDGSCDCVTVVSEGSRRVVTLRGAGDLITIDPISGGDINGDGFPDLVVSRYSGGAHCCFTTTVYSVGRSTRTVLAAGTGNCEGTFDDLDGDNVAEFSTCDDRWASVYCDFASSPMPPVVFAYNPVSRKYQVATPRFSAALQKLIDGELAEALSAPAVDGAPDPGAAKCRVLHPALSLMYTGRLDEGVALIRKLYRGGDLEAFVAEVVKQTRSSPRWKAGR
jgi:FG-GAP repeat